MEIQNFIKKYLIYTIKCNVTNRIYIGSTSNLTSRLNTHISSYKSGCCSCYSKIVLENNNYTVAVLKDNILSKNEAKKAEYHFIEGYSDQVVNKNKPILMNMKEYQMIYQSQYRRRNKKKESSNNI